MNELNQTDPADNLKHLGAPVSAELLDRLARLASRALRAPAALVGLATGEGSVAVSSIGLPEPWSSGRRVPLERSLCKQVITAGGAVVVEDAREDPLLEGDPAAEEVGAIAYAGLPLRSSEGRLLGCLCVIDREPRRWSDEELDTLGEFTSHLVAELEIRERTLKGGEGYFRTLVSGVHDIITVIDSSGSVLYDSPSLQHVLGYSPSERVGGHILDLVDPEDRGKALAALKKRSETQNDLPELTLRFRHRDGSLRVLEVRGRNLIEDPAVNGIVLTSRDVTERVLSEDQRDQALSLLRATLESTADGILVVDLEGRVKSYNQRLLDLWQVPPEVARTRDNRELLAWAAEQVEDPDAYSARSLSIHADREGESFDILTLKDGRTIERYSQPQRLGQEIVGRVLSFRDVTDQRRAEEALRESEERFRAFTEQALDIITVLDQDGTIRYDSPSVERVLGHTPEELLGRSAFDLIHPDDLPLVLAAFEDVLAEPGRPIDVELRFRHKDGSWRWLEASGRNLLGNPAVRGLVANSRDVTERKQAEEALRESEERLRLSHDASRMGVWEWHIQEGQVEWSPELERVHGREPGSFEGTFEAFRQDIHPEDLERVLEAVQEAVETRRDYKIEFRIVDSSGEVRWLMARGKVFSDESGAPLRMLGICGDVTERKTAEEEVREHRAFLSAVIHASPNLVFVHDRHGRYIMANEAVARTFGTTVEEVLGRTDQELGIAAEDAERFRREDSEVIESGELKLFPELPVTDPITGETRWYQKTKMPLEASGSSSVQVLGVATDITERVRAEEALHESEERYRLITQATNDLIYDWTLATDEVEWNGAASVFGHPLEGLRPHVEWFFEHLHPDDREGVESSLERIFKQGGQFWSYEYRFLRGDGRYATVLDRGQVVRDAAGEPVRMLGAVMDLTERRELEEELREAQKMEAVGRLAGGVAHELNNVLMEIKGNAQLGLVDLPSRDTRRAEFESIDKAADRAASLTRQLVAFGRKQMLRPEVIDLNKLVTGMEMTLQSQVNENIRVVSHLDPLTPLAKADPFSVEEVLRNLVLNAVDAMPEGGTVRIETGVGERGATSGESPAGSPLPLPWFSVSDTGAGMDEATLGRIWEPFFTTRKGKSGLGLSTAYGIVKQSGGEIRARSTPGEGSTFTVYLPVDPRVTTVLRSPTPPPPEEAGVETILLVEDEDGVRNLARRVLEREGYRVLEAGSAEEALRIAVEHRPQVHLLLTDVILPGMNGPQLARHLATARPGIKTIFMSGYTADEFGDDNLIQSAVAFISKPFGLRHLVEQVRDALKAG